MKRSVSIVVLRIHICAVLNKQFNHLYIGLSYSKSQGCLASLIWQIDVAVTLRKLEKKEKDKQGELGGATALAVLPTHQKLYLADNNFQCRVTEPLAQWDEHTTMMRGIVSSIMARQTNSNTTG